MPENIQNILDVIKDYGAAIISTISVGGVAAVAAIIIKVKDSINKTKEVMSSVLKKKEESEEQLSERYSELTTIIKNQNDKIETLTSEITKIKKK